MANTLAGYYRRRSFFDSHEQQYITGPYDHKPAAYNVCLLHKNFHLKQLLKGAYHTYESCLRYEFSGEFTKVNNTTA
jgi:hypothetical protein